jgi:hypothetical protein
LLGSGLGVQRGPEGQQSEDGQDHRTDTDPDRAMFGEDVSSLLLSVFGPSLDDPKFGLPNQHMHYG